MRGSIIKKIWYAVLLILLIFVLSRFNFQHLVYSVQKIHVLSIVLLIGLQLISQLLLNIQWHQTTKLSNINISFRKMLYINCQGSVVDGITPGVKFGGEATRAVQISRFADCSKECAAAVVAMQKIFSMGAFLFLYMVSLFFVAESMPYLWLTVLIITVLILVAVAIIYIFKSKIKGFIFVMRQQMKTLRSNPKVCILLALLSIFLWLLYPFKMYILTITIMPDINFIYITAITFSAYIIAMIPIFPGGLGGYEATMVTLLVTLGAIQSNALVVTALFRFTTFWLVMLFSLIFVGFFKVVQKHKVYKNTCS